ncbi:Protein lethal(2)essential for life [Toxocara canis]|nr:Protein lethal(2)essential for life [Toxocara canis]
MSMNRPDETPRRVPMLRRSSLGDHSQPSFHGHGVYLDWIDIATLSATHHPVSRLDFYGGSELKIDLDVSQFRREDISVKLCGNLLIIEGTHETRTENMCTVERRFVRKFEIPACIHYGTVSSKLSPAGVLRITVSK